jgi:hypothetical protein
MTSTSSIITVTTLVALMPSGPYKYSHHHARLKVSLKVLVFHPFKHKPVATPLACRLEFLLAKL